MIKKKIMLISSVLLTLILSIVIFNNKENGYNNIISNITKEEPIINSNMITMMYETEAGSGEYVETKDTAWPEYGYIFNDTLSGCENGGELEYNSQNNTVNLLSNSSDKCYVYFDKYDGVWIDNVVATNVTESSVTLNVDATSENGSITTYYYSLNDSEYVSSNTNPIVINDLNKLTEYNIKIYAVDNTGARSNIYEINVSTTDISIPVINSVEVSNITYKSFKLAINTTSDFGISKYYYIIESQDLSAISSNNSYTFDNLKMGTTYEIVILVRDNEGNLSNEYRLNVSTENLPLLANYIKDLYTSQGSNGLYYHTSSLANSADDNSYRYAGANPNNYICFGSDLETCPNDNLYRIIGVFGDQVKLIKYDYANSNLLGTEGAYNSANIYTTSNYENYTGNLTTINRYHWNKSLNNTWSQSVLNTTNLNSTFLNSISSTYRNQIADAIWYVNGYSTYSATPATWHDAESIGTMWTGKIGLMYVSDYGFAASPSAWTTNIESYNSSTIYSNNWMYMGINEWTISRSSSSTSGAYSVNDAGSVRIDAVTMGVFAIRPVFYLNSDVAYISGTGTESDPFRIE